MKSKCYICGNKIDIEKNRVCPFCQTNLDIDIVSKSNKIKLLKYEMLIYFTNHEFNKIILFLNNTYNSMLLEYFKLFSYKSLNKQYETSLFIDKYDYSDEELHFIINHALENTNIFNVEDIEYLISLSKTKDIYISRLNNNEENTKIKEKELRDILFSLTTIPDQEPFDSTKREGVAFVILASIIYITFILFILIFTSSEQKYYAFNISFIIPSFILTIGIKRIKKYNMIISLILFILILYVSTLIPFFIYNNVEITFLLDHFLGLLTSPLQLFKDIITGGEL